MSMNFVDGERDCDIYDENGVEEGTCKKKEKNKRRWRGEVANNEDGSTSGREVATDRQAQRCCG